MNQLVAGILLNLLQKCLSEIFDICWVDYFGIDCGGTGYWLP